MTQAATVLVEESAYVAHAGTTGNDVVYRFCSGGSYVLVGWTDQEEDDDDDAPELVVHPQGSVLAAADAVDWFTIEPIATDHRGTYFTDDAHPRLDGTYV